ncbi:MAG TPA: hypothetical protein PLN60_11125, partial [Bacillota bacterium]|nr:hypothetical protein [Bacillota bacterium]
QDRGDARRQEETETVRRGVIVPGEMNRISAGCSHQAAEVLILPVAPGGREDRAAEKTWIRPDDGGGF